MTYISLSRPLYGCGNVEALLLFCNLISQGPNKPYHAEFLAEKLLKRSQLWPVFLEVRDLFWMVRLSYKSALRKHFKLSSGGPLPNMITYFPRYNTIRYRPNGSGVIVTLDLTTEVLLVQSRDYNKVLRYSEKAEMTPPFRVNVDRGLFPSEICNFQVSLGEVVRLMQ